MPWPIISLIGAIAVLLSIVIMVTNSSNSYYKLAGECVQAGGSFIPTGASAICLNARDKATIIK